MAILIDLSQIAISNLMMSPNIKTGDVDENLIKHMILNSIRTYKQKFGREYGEIVICCDSKHYWRRDIFPHYKAARKEGRKKSKFDWGEVFTAISNFKQDLKDYFPYKVVEFHGAEGDDVIAIISQNINEKTIIVGSDKDYGQLQKHDHIKQYSPTKKEFINVLNPDEFLQELVICGDKSDGIPNIKSDADTFVTEKRQSPIRKNDLAKWVTLEPKMFCESRKMLENFERNKRLIDFTFIPDNIKNGIIHEFIQKPKGNKKLVLDYFMKNRMKMLIRDLDQF